MVISKFNNGNWNDGIWGREEDEDGIIYTYMGNLVFLTNTNSKMSIVSVPFAVYGTQIVTIAAGDTITKVRKAK